MPELAISLLGPFQLQYGEQTLSHLPGRSSQALLILLAVEGRDLQREQLVEYFWPGMPLSYGRKNLRQTLYELRQIFPEAAAIDKGQPVPLLLADRQTISLNPEAAVTLDIDQFEAYLRKRTVPDLTQAANLYRGEFLSDFFLPDSETFEEWAGRHRAAYRLQMLEALELLSEEALAVCDFDQALRQTQRALEMDDLREAAVRQQMRALEALDRRVEALQIYDDLRRRLHDELEVEPAAETTALWQSVRQGDSRFERRPAASPQLRHAQPAEALPANNLPPQATPFIGREHEIEQLVTLLESPTTRLVTLLGPGGIGKSRLSLAVAERLATKKTFPDGIWFVRLAAFDEAQQIGPAITAELPFDIQGRATDPQSQILDFLREKKMLLILDNLEQLLSQSSLPLLQAILAQAPGVTLLTTSRAQLRLPGEQIIPLSGLRLPPAQDISSFYPSLANSQLASEYDGLRLFEMSAQRVRPDFRLNGDNLEDVLDIGRRVEGFPLGLEMAAAWTELLPPSEIADQLKESFDLLEASWTAASKRHQSARAVFEWSWRLLNEDERSLCAALSVFRSGFGREAALAVGAASLKSLLSLSRKSWLQQSGGRFHIHELLRQYAAEKLAGTGAMQQEVQARHAQYFAAYYERLGKAVRSGDQRQTLEAIDADFENARMAWSWFLEQGGYTQITRGLLPAMFVLTSTLGSRYELYSLIQQTRVQAYHAGHHELNPAEMLALNTAEGMLGYDFYHSDLFGAETVVGRPVQLFAWEILKERPDDYTKGTWAVFAAAMHAWMKRQEGLDMLQFLAKEYEEQGDQWSQAIALQQLGRRMSNRSTETDPMLLNLARVELVQAKTYLEQALAYFQISGDLIEQGRTLGLIGFHERSGDPAAAVTYFERAIAMMENAGLPANPTNYSALAMCCLTLGEFDKAFLFFAQMRQKYEQQGNRSFLAQTMSLESMQAMRYGDLELARELRIRAGKILAEGDYDITWIYSIYEAAEIERVAGNWQLAREKYEQALTLFQTRGGEGKIPGHGTAFCMRGLGDIALDTGDFAGARAYFEKTLHIANLPYEHRWLKTLTYSRLGRALVGLGDLIGAKQNLVQATYLASLGEKDWYDLLMDVFECTVALYTVAGRFEEALTLAVFTISNVATWQEVRRRLETAVAALQDALPPAIIAAAHERGQKMTLLEALSLAELDGNDPLSG